VLNNFKHYQKLNPRSIQVHFSKTQKPSILYSIIFRQDLKDKSSSLFVAFILAESDYYPSIREIFHILLTMPIGSVPCKRSFSALRRQKQWNRTAMVEYRLNGLALLYIHRDVRVGRYRRVNQNSYIEEEQTTQWPKENKQKDKQRIYTYKTKDRVKPQALEFRTPFFPHLVPPAIMVWILVWKYILEPFIHILQNFVLQLSRSTNFCF